MPQIIGNTIDGWRVLAVVYTGLDPSKPLIALLGDTTVSRSYQYAVVQLTGDGLAFAEDVTPLTDDDSMAWEEFGDRSA